MNIEKDKYTSFHDYNDCHFILFIAFNTQNGYKNARVFSRVSKGGSYI